MQTARDACQLQPNALSPGRRPVAHTAPGPTPCDAPCYRPARGCRPGLALLCLEIEAQRRDNAQGECGRFLLLMYGQVCQNRL